MQQKKMEDDGKLDNTPAEMWNWGQLEPERHVPNMDSI